MENNLVFPILGKDNKFPFVLMDLSQLYIPPSTPTIVMNHQLSEYVENFRGQQEGIPYGGFFEKRFIYLSSTHFGTDQNRDIHLGIDLWLDPYTPIFASKDGIVHSVAYNAAELDYGWCVIIQYGQNEFVLYGHMASDLLKDYRSGDVITQGMIIGYTGDYAENGGWYPHLHLQVMNTMLDYHGDFIGVCNEGDIPY
nr:peptidoglycan DD-metalloendopeptidase family protein [Saprospiraceae bacterium]